MRMRFVLLALVVGLVGAVSCQPGPRPLPEPMPLATPEAAAPPRHALYLSLVWHDWRPCRDNRGIAWFHESVAVLNRAASCWYYDSNSWEHLANGRSLVMIRPDYVPEEDIIARIGRNHDGYVIVLNEPKQPHQDEIEPYEAVLWVGWIRSELPNARLVGANILAGEAGYRWLEDYVALGGPDFDVQSLHIYPESGCEPMACVDRLCAIVDCGGGVWITEIGFDYARADCYRFGEWLDALEADERVGRIFGYTAVGGCCGQRLAFYRADGRATCTGEQW